MNGHTWFLKITIIKGEKVFVLVFQALDIMSNTLKEVPDDLCVELLNLESTILINSSEEKWSIVHETHSAQDCY